MKRSQQISSKPVLFIDFTGRPNEKHQCHSRLIPPLEYEVWMPKLCFFFDIKFFLKNNWSKNQIFSNYILSLLSQSKSATFEKKSDQIQGHADD